MGEVWFRNATAEDAASLSDAARESFVETFGHTYRPEDLAAFVAASYSPAAQLAEILHPEASWRLALTLEGEVVGFCQIGAYGLPMEPGRGRALELKRLYVRAPWHGAGVAAALMDWAIAQARGRFAEALFLGVWRENARAQRFYARYGFEKVGEYQFIVGAARDEEDILRLDLSRLSAGIA